MAKDKLTDYDATAANNTDVGGISVAEGMLPSGVNNAIREQMSHLKDFASGTTGIDVLSLADDDASHAIKLQAPSAVTADTTFTLPDGDGVSGQTMITDGAGALSWAAPYGNRNLIINGAMQVAQRGTSVASSSGSVVRCVDRYRCFARGAGAATFSQTSTTPTGQGFANSLRVDVTTVDSSLDTNDLYMFDQRFEGQNLQQLAKGTSDAKSVTASFWVRSTKTGTYILELFDDDNNRNISKTYSISSADTWEYKTVTFEGDTTGALDNDNGSSLTLRWFLAAGTSYNSGTLATAWEASVSANRVVGQVNFFDSTSNDFYITGVQLEVGSATPFEHRSYGDELARCQRYFYAVNEHTSTFDYPFFVASAFSTTQANGGISLPVPMRATPTNSYGNSFRFYRNSTYDAFTTLANDGGSNLSLNFAGSNTLSHTAGTSGNIQVRIPDGGYIEADAEL